MLDTVQDLPRILRNTRTPYWFALKKWHGIDRCLADLALLEMLEEENDRVTKRGKTRHLIKRRGEKGYFNNIVRKQRHFRSSKNEQFIMCNLSSAPRKLGHFLFSKLQ